ncbi:shikimate dehydrogenase [Pantoea sp. Aalb]|uniref:shikimate dehydrogenase n=1 Tax=Pantoea sp. Aalb TaxID=2576762 RepID=UPI00132BAF5A|nr:shikimate dehydrogenase [Pantoea sp. Aalb]MXP67912.1 shikimate dehydrogenase [Pantoea sp. Aalb]
MKNFAVFGNPIAHSKSPIIHSLFAQQTGVEHCYEQIYVPIDAFIKSINEFFMSGGKGANVTLPFKQQAWTFADELSDRSILSGAVNTLKKNTCGTIIGDNTDGVGLLIDLKRLNMINPGNRILLVGAGGAARGVILPLLSLGCSLVIVNRTFEKAKKLVNIFQHKGNIEAISFKKLINQHFDLIINATSSSMDRQVPSIPSSLIFEEICCYDMFYQQGLTSFLSWCQKHGSRNISDGLGMLVGQAAYSFQFWHNIMPEINPVINYLKKLNV